MDKLLSSLGLSVLMYKMGGKDLSPVEVDNIKGSSNSSYHSGMYGM